ncbi:MAG: hypothetical protein E6Q95_02330 [Chitinophagaceae bacterium]|nr:MAG: hypothetical protein E6Q95_02330 [Chitinophagaceae bacterium]
MQDHRQILHNFEATPPTAVWERIVDELNAYDEVKHIKNSLDAIATPPPSQAWDTICQHLNETNGFSAFEEKLNQIEIIPPTQIWDQLSTQLESLNEERKISKTISQIEVVPPVETWAQIQRKLDHTTSSLQNIEVTPPAHLWDQIQQKLDQSDEYIKVAATLQHIEIAPPAQVWNQIQATLDETKENKKESGAKIISINSAPNNNWKKYIAIAASIAFIAFLGIRLSDFDNENTNSLASTEIKSNTTESTDTKNTSTQQESIANVLENNTPAFNPSISPNDKDLTKNKNTASDISTAKNNEEKPITSRKNDYLVLMTNDGEIVRLSKKAGNMARCISGEHADGECNEKLKEIQKEVSSKTILSGPLDILSLATQEEKL